MSVDKQDRETALNRWAIEMLGTMGTDVPAGFSIRLASGDASFRRYFRGELGSRSFIFVDAPPSLENSEPFVRVSRLLRDAGIAAPEVIRFDLDAGFMMLTDFGDRHYFDVLHEDSEDLIEALYTRAFEDLVKIQRIETETVPVYDERLLRGEMALFTEWFLPRQLELEPTLGEREAIARVMDLMVENALAQPRVFVHRDFHCRNLMVLDAEAPTPGVIDFQDAVAGPVTYDLVSALKDCYHRFEPAFVARHLERFRIASGNQAVSPEEFRRWFDWMGLQRHIKVAGIFSRLSIRDGKPRYLQDIPLVVDYMAETARTWPELQAFAEFLETRILPRMPAPARP